MYSGLALKQFGKKLSNKWETKKLSPYTKYILSMKESDTKSQWYE